MHVVGKGDGQGERRWGMFIGHFGVAFGLKRMAPRAPLAALVAAAVWADMLWTVFLLLGWEHVRMEAGATRWVPLDLYDYPLSHSLLMLSVWAVVLALAYRAWRSDTVGALAVGIAVLSHWVLDWLTHRPDMPLYPGGPRFGLGLWNSIAGTLAVELPMFLGGAWLYATATRASDRIGRWGFWTYVAAPLTLYFLDHFNTSPVTAQDLAWSGLIGTAVLVAWAWWFDRHRETVAKLLPAREAAAQKA